MSLGNFLFVDISPNSGWRSNFGVRRVRGRIRATLTGVQPPLDGQRIDRETNPKSPAKELSWFKVSQAAGGKEQPHHRAGGSDTQQDCDSPQHPSSLQKRFASAQVPVRANQRKQKEGVEEQDGGALHPSAESIDAHRVGGESDHAT